jgi:hypothetical protein
MRTHTHARFLGTHLCVLGEEVILLIMHEHEGRGDVVVLLGAQIVVEEREGIAGADEEVIVVAAGQGTRRG